MKPSLFRAIPAIAMLAIGLGACSPSPYYTGSRSGFAPGAVPRDGMGRPVLDGKAVEYSLPPPAPAVTTDIAGRVIASASENQIIYFEDLRYSNRQQQVAGANVRDRAYRP